MTVQSKSTTRPSSVTTGPIAGSRKIYSSPEGRPDILVPFREIALDPSAKEEPYRAYDCSGVYTDPSVTIDLEAGLPPIRREWLAKRGFDRITPRAVRPEDNGNVGADKLVPACPADLPIYGGKPGQMVTQYEFARAGIITDEMIYVAHRENMGRTKMIDGAEEPRRRRRKLRRGNSGVHHPGIRAQRDRARPGDHSGEHQPSGAGAGHHRP